MTPLRPLPPVRPQGSRPRRNLLRADWLVMLLAIAAGVGIFAALIHELVHALGLYLEAGP